MKKYGNSQKQNRNEKNNNHTIHFRVFRNQLQSINAKADGTIKTIQDSR